MTGTMAQLAGALAGRYTVVRELGQGGMATVYLAEDVRHRRQVALKVLHPELSAVLGPERFLQEIELTASLQHPHILPLFDSGSADGQLFYVMPFVEGETLRARLARERQLPVADAVRLAREVADALAYAHGRGVIHRDIKPENILLQGGHALVADFGIALAVQHAGGQRMTQTGLSLGTPQYMAPEQAMGERSVDHRADVYALGAVTYEMLTGEPPFTGPTAQAIVARVLTTTPTPLTQLRRAVPAALEAAVLTALEKLPADRFASAADFAAALTGATPVTQHRSGPSVVPGARRVTVVAVAVAIVSLLAALAGWLRPVPAPAPVLRYRIALDGIAERRPAWGEMALSPNGSHLAHAGGPDGQLLVRRRDSLGFTPFPGTQGAQAPFFSSDGSQLGFVVGTKLMVVPLAGGVPIVYADSLPPWQDASWGEDGFIYLTDDGGIARFRATPGATRERITTLDTAAGEVSHVFPEILPEGRALLFTIDTRNKSQIIAIADPRTGKHTHLLAGTRARYARSGHLVYVTTDGRLWAVPFDVRSLKVTGRPMLVGERLRATVFGPIDFAVSADGTLAYATDDNSDLRQLAWVGRDGRSAPVDSTWTGAFESPALSPDGRWISVTLREASAEDIWLHRLDGGTRRRLTFGGERSFGAVWAPDGRTLAYLSGSRVSPAVWSRGVDGSAAAVELMRSPRALSELEWSPAGDWLLARTTTPTAGAGDILAFRPGAAGGALTPAVASRNSEYTPTFSPDGRWLAYTSNESGRFEVYVVPFPRTGDAKWQVSTKGGISPRWSRRGGEIFYLDEQSRMTVVEVGTTPSFSVGRTTALFNASEFVVTATSRRNFDLSVDDSRFLMVRRARGAGGAQLVVVERWFAELERAAKGVR